MMKQSNNKNKYIFEASISIAIYYVSNVHIFGS